MKPTINIFYKRMAFSFIIVINVFSSVYGQKESTVTFSVFAYDKAHNPLKDVTVTIDQTRQQPNRKTDSNGLIEFTNIKPGQIVIRANKEGYNPAVVTTSAMPNGYESNNWFRIELEKIPYTKFTIHVYDENKRIVEQAHIKIKQLGAHFVTTDTKGQVEFKNQPVREIDILVVKEGFDVFEKQYKLVADSSKNNFDVDLIKTKNNKLVVYGDLIDAKKNYILNADINIKVLPFDTNIKSDTFGNFYSTFDYKQINSNEIEIKVYHADYQKTDKIVRTIQPGQLLYKIHELGPIILKKKLI